MLILKGDSNAIKEVFAGLSKRFERTADDIDIVEKEEGMKFVYNIGCLQTCLPAAIINYM